MTDIVKLSRFISKVLRHQPELIGLSLDAGGWAQVDELLQGAQKAEVPLTRELLDRVVAENDKRRFAFSEDGQRIRASQGHSIPVDLGLAPLCPPEVLFHGTALRFLDSIHRSGLIPRSRQYVHLSADAQTAQRVGQRHGSPVVLTVQAGQMQADGLLFYRSANGVWLTLSVPARYLIFT
jgi:putative RNA 2'-phosphotransferase